MNYSRQFPDDTGVLIVGHGTRDSRGQAEFLQTAQMLQAAVPGVALEACFLELAAPDIAAGVAALAARGIRRFIAAPLLLFTAGHAKQDIPDAISEAVKCYPEISWQMAAPLESHSAILNLSAERFREAISDINPADRDITLLLVSRGSSDAEAIASVHKFAERRRELTPVAAQQVCFLAAAQPKFIEAIAWATAQSSKTIVVQPHLLFHGQLIQEITTQIVEVRQTNGTDKRWHVAQHLGPAKEVVDALIDRIVAGLANSPSK